MLHSNIFDHWDINFVSFSNKGIFYFLLNVYSDNYQNALIYLKNTEVNLNNILVMTRDCNIRDSDWNLSCLHYFPHTETLLEIADGLGL